MTDVTRNWRGILVWCALAAPAAVTGAEVAVRLRDTSIYVGQPFQIYVQMTGTREAAVPELEASPDFGIRHVGSAPAVQDGRSRVVATFEVIPLQSGTLRLPGGSVQIGGRSLAIPETAVEVKEPVPTSRMTLEIALSHQECYVGEPVVLTVTWTSALSFNGIRAVNLQLPALASPLFKVHPPFPEVDPAGEKVVGLPVSRERIIARYGDAVLDGEPAVAITFQRVLVPLRATDHPLLLPGATLLSSFVEPRDARFKGARYPSYFNNDFFETDLSGQYERLIVRSAPLTLRVLPLPEEGRPSGFTGMIGAFGVEAAANPVTVAVGQPFSLRLRVFGHPFPKLLDLPSALAGGILEQQFQLPTTTVRPVPDGEDFLWSVPLRPRHADVPAVPALEFAYFDPRTRAYGAATTAAVPLTVTPAETVAAAEARFADGSRLRNEILPEPGGIFHNVTGPSLLAEVWPGGWTWSWWAWTLLFALPPMVFGAVACASRGWRLERRDPLRARRELAFRRFRRRIRRLGEPLDPHATSIALRQYFLDRYDLPVSQDLDAVREFARRQGVGEEALEALEEWLGGAERAAFSPGGESVGGLEIRSLIGLVRQFEPTRRRPAWLAALLAAGGLGVASGAVDHPGLVEAEAFFERANEEAPVDPAKAGRLYRLAAERYESLLRDGVAENGFLHYNIGNAWYLAGDHGRAILHYRRAERWLPGDRRLRLALDQVRSERFDAFPLQLVTPAWRLALFWHYAWNDQTRLQVIGGCLAFAWLLGTVRLFRRFEWFSRGLVLAGGIALAMAASSLIHARDADRDHAVIVEREVTARKGDASVYAPAFSAPLHAGSEVVVLEERRDWMLVRVEDGNEGWIPGSAVERVRPR